MDISRRTFANAAALLYFAGGLLVLWDFPAAPPDGLANVPLALHVASVTAAGLAVGQLTGLQFPFVFQSLGYYGSHAAYFLPALAVCTILLRRVIGGPATPKSHSEDSNR